jgi:hypothetical protein
MKGKMKRRKKGEIEEIKERGKGREHATIHIFIVDKELFKSSSPPCTTISEFRSKRIELEDLPRCCVHFNRNPKKS